MSILHDFMSADHRRCDDLFAVVEHAVDEQRWDAAQAAFAGFRAAVEAHFRAEEEVLFPAFERATGMSMGPTRVMCTEHAQLQDLLVAAADALVDRDPDAYRGEAETLLIMVQQHNMKEENILYPMCDGRLAEVVTELRVRLQDFIATPA